MKFIKCLTILLAVIFMSGCGNPVYMKNIENAYSELKVGMTKSEVDNLFGRFKFLKEQTVTMYSNSDEEDMRHTLLNYIRYKNLSSKGIFSKVTFDGNTKVFSYLIKQELNWPNGWLVDYVAIFYNNKDDKVFGWAKIVAYGKAKTWGDTF